MGVGGRCGGVGAYSRWVLIRGWALIRINTVIIVIYKLCNNQSSKFIITALHLLHCFYIDEIMKEIFLYKWCKV